MAEWLDSILPEGYAAALLWVAGALLLLVVILLVIRLARSLTSGTFISGGRNRRARLAVMDATPVDSKRRLVLIRRDDVEHLVLIGGTTDVVIERDIRMMPRSKPAAPQAAPLHEEPAADAPRRAAPPEPVKPAAPPISRPALTHNVALPRPAMPMSAPPVAPDRNGRTPPASNRSAEPPWKRPQGSAAAESKKDPDLDEALARELQVSLDEPPAGGAAAPTIDDEMNRILGELSGDRR